MKCAVCKEEVDRRLELDGIVTHLIIGGEPRPVHGRCCRLLIATKVSEEE